LLSSYSLTERFFCQARGKSRGDGSFVTLRIYYTKKDVAPKDRLFLIKDKERFLAFRPFSVKRPDAASALSDESLEDSGFYCVIDTKGLSRFEELSLCYAVKTGEKLTAFEFASS